MSVIDSMRSVSLSSREKSSSWQHRTHSGLNLNGRNALCLLFLNWSLIAFISACVHCIAWCVVHLFLRGKAPPGLHNAAERPPLAWSGFGGGIFALRALYCCFNLGGATSGDSSSLPRLMETWGIARGSETPSDLPAHRRSVRRLFRSEPNFSSSLTDLDRPAAPILRSTYCTL